MSLFDEFIFLILKKEYFKAHEILEEYWHTIRKTSSPYKNVYRGFINAAVAMELKKRGNKNYKKVWNTYEKYRPLYLQKEEYIKVMNFLDSKKP